MQLDEWQLDRSRFRIGTFDDDDAGRFWKARAPAERLAALEFLRQAMYDYDRVADRIQRVLEILDLKEQ